MKSWAFAIVTMVAVVSFSFQAEAKKSPVKRKVVVISFTESDLKQSRLPASIEDQKEMAAEARHMARLSEANDTVPEM